MLPGLQEWVTPDAAPGRLAVLGDIQGPVGADVALFCSVRCPGAQIVAAYDAVRRLRDAGLSAIGGFHAPMERECLDLLLRGRGPTLVCLPRSIERLRVPSEWRAPLADGRLVIVSPFVGPARRQNRADAHERNRVAAALADRVLIFHAEPGSGTDRLAHEALGWSMPVYVLDGPGAEGLVARGARPVRAATAPADMGAAVEGGDVILHS